MPENPKDNPNTEVKKAKEVRRRCWFLTLNNPEKNQPGLERYAHVDTDGEVDGQFKAGAVVDALMDAWLKEDDPENKKERRGVGCCYEIGDEGTRHCHIVICSRNPVPWSQVKKLYPKADIESGRGNTRAIEDYLEKQGKHKKKAHTQVISARYRGRIANDDIKPGAKVFKDLDNLISEGCTPDMVYRLGGTEYASHANAIERYWAAKKDAEIPDRRPQRVFWHLGDSGSGKSHYLWTVADEMGGLAGNIYLVKGDKKNAWDKYAYEPVLWLDELRSGDFSWNLLLDVLDEYPLTLPCRYANKRAAWNTIHITSIIPPDVLYFNASKDASPEVQEAKRQQQVDSFKQLSRRIEAIFYHYVDPWEPDEGKRFKWFTIPIEAYKNLADLKLIADKRIATSRKAYEEKVAPPMLPLEYGVDDVAAMCVEDEKPLDVSKLPPLYPDIPF